jgi:hypothetical protein
MKVSKAATILLTWVVVTADAIARYVVSRNLWTYLAECFTDPFLRTSMRFERDTSLGYRVIEGFDVTAEFDDDKYGGIELIKIQLVVHGRHIF